MSQDGTWLWDNANSVWVKAPAVVTVKRMTATGSAVAGACKLYWIACSPDSAGAEFELSDTLAGGAIVYDHFDNDKDSEQLVINPPMPFTTGIYVDKFDKMKSLVFGYI